ncbi:helix-turn-helix domain-containing protein [Bdellovibrio bacteriovorus]|uniref:helix-turn-helix domain-containing protein n=1 Tax=Bdellovibrio bacteriovorus TaxID=959 RepID=UPI00059FD1B7|nr:helix-turn-helix transcriptional regulator [Bdellovibrio bacteriovorus]
MKSEKRRLNESNDEHWGNRLQSVLDEKGISRRQIAKAIGVAPSVIDSWVRGAAPNDLKAVKRLADNVDCSFSWLLTGEEEAGNGRTVSELFQSVPYFDGYARIRIDRLVPRKKNNRDAGELE